MTPRSLFAVVGLVVLALAGPDAHAVGAPPAPVADGAADGADGPGADELVSFGIAPAGPERPDDRPYVAVSAAPGSVVYEHVALVNQNDQPIDLDVYAGDVRNVDGGGLGVSTRDEVPRDAGAWLAVDGPSRVTVPAQTADGIGYVVVPVAITIPANAEPGDHVAGIVASLTSAGRAGENAPSVDLEQRVAARVYVHVDGELAPGLVVRGVATSWAPGLVGTGTATVRYTLENTGNVAMAVEPRVSVGGPFGTLAVSRAGDRVDLLLPGGAAQLTTTVPGVWPLLRDEVTVRAVVVAPPGGTDPGLGAVTARTGFWAVPWLALALLAGLVALVVWRVRRVRARRRRLAQAPDGTRRAARRVPVAAA